ncbi:MAG: PAS domain-containing sensor histidine kinase [Chloroflexi bacterium]|nr:PAS domain-containing sensor histidine kinase [Chloroflexota bacterium]
MTGNGETNGAPDERRLEESLEDLYEHAPCGYISTLPDGTFIKVNQTFLDWTGYSREELLAVKRLQDVLTIGGQIFYETHYAPLLDMQGFANEISFDVFCRDRRRMPILLNTVQQRDPAGNPLLNRTIVLSARDRRQYERELQQARKKAEEALDLRNQFLSLAAHELKTPLTSIMGHIELFQRRTGKEHSLNERDERALRTIAEQAQRLNKMIASLLDISRIETGQLAVEQVPIDLCALVNQVVDEVQSTLAGRQIELLCPIQPLIIQGDELRLRQVFQNLIQNALKYSHPDVSIAVAIRQEQAEALIEVRDRGIGIPQTAVPQLFNRFYRADNVDQENVSGLGIGLYVVKEIVELHSGSVTVTSTEGEGSTFTVCLPLDSTLPF